MSIPGRVDWRRVVSTALGVLAGLVATAGTLAVAVAGFTLSYDAIRKVGIAAGVRPDWAWLLPVSIDGAMAVGTVTAVVMSRMGRPVWYPWLVVLTGAGISIACNALHAQMRDQIKLDDNTAMAVSAIPAVMLALSVHLLVVLIDAAARTFGEPDSVADTEADTADDMPTDPWATYSTPLTAPPAIEADTKPAPKRTSVRTPARTSAATDTARKVAKLAAKTPDITPAIVAAKLEISERTARRHLSAIRTDTEPDTGADTPTVNGHEVPELVPTT